MRRQRIVMVLCALFALTVGVANATADKGGNPANSKQKGGNPANAKQKGGKPANAKRKGGNSANAHLCQKGGWMKLRRSDGTPFANQGKCVSYAAHGGKLISPSGADISLSYSGQTLTVANAGPLAASVTVAVFRACGGGYGPHDGFDVAFSPTFATYTSKQPIPAGQSLTIVVFQGCETHAQVTASSQPDPDSVPNNGVTTEDDYVVIPRGF